MHFLKLMTRNALRHRLRTLLTAAGLVVAILAFGLLRTVVEAWYAGAEGASATRLVTRNAISLVFPLPISYRDRIRRVPGVRQVAAANWFGGVYVSEKNFFPQFAVEASAWFELFPEFVLKPEELKAFQLDRKGCVIGRKLADTYGFKPGDIIPIRGTIYPGNWEFVVRAIYDGVDPKTDTSQFFFHWENLSETLRRSAPRRADQAGIYFVGVTSPERMAEVGTEIDRIFRNSLAETYTETEKAFQLGFVAMTEAIVAAIRIVSFVVILIILAVMANTMAMTARERMPEYATLKALGFGPWRIGMLVAGESLAVAIAGAAVAVALTFPIADWFAAQMGTLFPVFHVSGETVALQCAAALAVGLLAALVPAVRAARVRIVDGLRSIA